MPLHINELSATESVAIFRALASESRARILELLSEKDMNINELSSEIGLAQPSVTKHIQILEDAGLVLSDYLAGPQGMQKRCRRVHDRLVIEMSIRKNIIEAVAEVEVPIGMFTGIEALVTCGLATRDHFIGLIDSPLSFVMPERANAQILWSSGGFVEYTFANTLPLNSEVTAIDIAVEICSEAPGYANEYPSDVTLWINDIDIGTWCSPGDLGGTRGRLNPPWWPDNMNQSGLLKVWHIDNDGASVDGVRISSVNIGELGIRPWQPTKVRFGVKAGARNQGGFTLFGKGFGNYEQDVVFRIRHVATTDNPAPALLHQPSVSSISEEAKRRV